MPKTRETLTTRVTRLEELSEILLQSQVRTDEILRKSGEETDRRIRDLVVAIGELISRMPADRLRKRKGNP
jgi:hypothetical protein